MKVQMILCMHIIPGSVNLNKIVPLTFLMLVLGVCVISFVTEPDESNEYLLDTGKIKSSGLNNEITINASVPDVGKTLPYYKVIKEEKIRENVDKVIAPRKLLPSEEEAVEIANKFLEERNSLPEGVYMSNVETFTIKTSNEDSGSVEKETPAFLRVSYNRILDGYPVVGPGDSMEVCIGEKEEIVYFFKTWREVQNVGEVSILDVNSAIEKLNQGDSVQPVKSGHKPVEINEIEIGYYSDTPGEKQDFYKPVWIFRGTDEEGDDITRYVNASS
ncbi:two-component system regulatory protein YycI [Methanosarcina siciliae]|nr:two-component system regulatory protein YycI [Methanosarcina siciliae]